MIIKQRDYIFNEKLAQVWGTYCEYKINQDYLVVFKDGLREGQECTEQLQLCIADLQSQPSCHISIVNQENLETSKQ